MARHRHVIVRRLPWHVWCFSLREHYADTKLYLEFPMCHPYLGRYTGFHAWDCMWNWQYREKNVPLVTLSSGFWRIISSAWPKAKHEEAEWNESKEGKRTDNTSASVCCEWKLLGAATYSLSLVFYCRSYHEWYTRASRVSVCWPSSLSHCNNFLSPTRGFALLIMYSILLWALDQNLKF